MISEGYKPDLLQQNVSLFRHTVLRVVVISSLVRDKEPFFSREFNLLDKVIGKTKMLSKIPKENRNQDLTNLYNPKYPYARMRTIIAMSDRTPSKKCNEVLQSTINTVNDEVDSGYYKDPGRIFPESDDVFRFYLWDVYARWVAKWLTRKQPVALDVERDISNLVINGLCEATVVGAEEGDNELIEATKWLHRQDWLDKKWGFSEGLVARAKTVTLGSAVLNRNSTLVAGL